MAQGDLDSAQAVMHASLDAIIIADDKGIVQEFNAAAEAMFGYGRSEALGRSIGDLIVPDHHRAAHEAGMHRYNSGQPARVLGRRMEMEAMRADGAIFPVELAITEAKTGDRRYFAASLRDLSERHAVEKERANSRAFLQALVDDQTDIVIRSDAAYRVMFCNLAAARFFGVDREALIGQIFAPGTPPEVQAQL
jgi:PAS domain S-box-containing protein